MKINTFILPTIAIASIISGLLAFKIQKRFSGRIACYTTIGSGIPKTYKFLSRSYTTSGPVVLTLNCTIPGPSPYIIQLVTLNVN